MKKQLVFFLMALLPMVVWADGVKINGIYYNLSGTTAEVTSNPSKYSGAIVIPPSVTYGTNSYTVTGIGDRAFYQCTGLTELTIPASITYIGNTPGYADVFRGCNGNVFTKVKISDLEAWCRITFADDSYANPLIVAHHLYLNDSEITDLVIPNTITTLGTFQFEGCHGITSLTIPSNVTDLGMATFYYCKNLTTVNIAPGLTSIGVNVFNSCEKLASVNIPNTVTTIKSGAFCYSGLTSINIPNSVTTIEDCAFNDCNSLQTVIIPSSVTSIDASAFINCTNLQSVTVGRKTPATVNSNAFFNSTTYYKPLYVPKGKLSNYQAAEGWNKFGTMHEVESVPLTIGNSGIASFCSIFDLDFNTNNIWKDVVPYAIKSYDAVNCKVTLEVAEYLYVPAGKGVVVMGNPGTYNIPVNPKSTFNTLTTMLKGVSSDTPLSKVEGEYTNYILGEKNGEVGFYAITDGSILRAGKAYLPIPTSNVPSPALQNGISIVIDGINTGINGVYNGKSSEKNLIYNMQGQKLNQPRKGVNFINGKKVLIK